MSIKYTNNSESTLAGNITAGQTANIPLAVGTGVKFPEIIAPDYMYATLVDQNGVREVIKITAKTSGTDFLETVVRAADTIENQAGAAAPFVTGDKVQCRLPIAAIMGVDGTTSDFFQIDTDGTGITLKHDTQELKIRNLSDAAYANLLCADLTLSGALALAGNITGALAITMSGALSGVTTLAMAGALSGVTTLAMGGALTGATDITASGTVQAEHLYTTDDAVIDDDLTVTGKLTATGDAAAVEIDNESADVSIKARDHGTASTPEVVNVVYGTGAAPAAGTTPEGTIFVKYIA